MFLSLLVSLLSQSSGMKVLGKVLFLVLPFSRPHSPPLILMVLYTECFCPEADTSTVWQLLYLFSCSPLTSAIARAVFYMLDYVVSVIKSTQKLLLLYTLWCVVHYIPSYNSFSIVYDTIQHMHLELYLFVTWDGWEDTTQFSLLCNSDK